MIHNNNLKKVDEMIAISIEYIIFMLAWTTIIIILHRTTLSTRQHVITEERLTAAVEPPASN